MKRHRPQEEQPQQRQRRRQQQRRQVLSEEEYTSTLSSIIQRDYFPQAQQLERQNALLDRRLEGDVVGAVAVRRATRQLMQQEELRAIQRQQEDVDLVAAVDVADISGDSGGETTQERQIKIRSRPRPLQDETITGFHARVTNEDDHEFETNQTQEVQANRHRLEDVFSLKKAITGTEKLLEIEDELASDDFNSEPNRIAAADWQPPAIRNPLFFNPTLPLIEGGGMDGGQKDTTDDGRLLTGASNGNSATAGLGSSTTTTTLMLPPSQQHTQSMITQRRQQQQQQQASEEETVSSRSIAKHELVEYIPKQHSLGGEKTIDPTQTRFPSKALAPTRSQHHGGLVDLPYNGGTGSDTDDAASMSVTDASSHYSTDLDAPMKSVEEERQNRQRQQINNRKQRQQLYVAMTPIIVPGTGRESSPITTWGTMDGTPLVLSGQETMETGDSDIESKSGGSASAFTLPAEPLRERAARDAESKLAKRAERAKQPQLTSFSKHKRRQQQDGGIQHDGIAQGVRGRAGPLTPSAMSLLRKTSSKQGKDMFTSSLRRSYTPKRASSSLSSFSSSRMSSSSARSSKRQLRGSGRPDHAYNATPLLSEQQKK